MANKQKNKGRRTIFLSLLKINILTVSMFIFVPIASAIQNDSLLAGIRAQVGYFPEAFGVITVINVGAVLAIRYLRGRMHLKRGQ